MAREGVTIMTLKDVVAKLDSFESEHTIYASRPWTETSTALVLQEPDEGGVPEEATSLGLNYFIEIFLASEFLEDWAASLAAAPTIEEMCRRLIVYAENDA